MQTLLKKVLDRILLLFTATAIVAVLGTGLGYVQEMRKELRQAEEKLKAAEERSVTIKAMKEYVFFQMNVKKVKFSEGKKDAIAQDIAEVVTDVFDRDDHRKGFITMIGMESSFNTYAQSPTGPKGMAQTAKSAFFEGLGACSTLKYDHDDVWVSKIGVLAGACYYKRMLAPDIADGDPFTAGLAYNQGPNSEDVKTWKKTGFIKPGEGDNYLKKMVRYKKDLATN